VTAMHAEGRRFIERVQREREAKQRHEIADIRRVWDRLPEREKALILATYYDDIVVPPEPRKRWWRR
jgi:hypothetical protein